MAELIVEIENNVDTNFLRRIIENIKGVRNVSFNHATSLTSKQRLTQPQKNWLQRMEALGGSIDWDIVDMSDEKTRYILSK